MAKLNQPSKTTTVHVGNDRWLMLSAFAIDISFHAKKQVTPPGFMRYLIDNFGDVAKEKMLAEILAGNVTSDE